jgi:hypothetical protein
VKQVTSPTLELGADGDWSDDPPGRFYAGLSERPPATTLLGSRLQNSNALGMSGIYARHRNGGS